jgi:hypothetical protein
VSTFAYIERHVRKIVKIITSKETFQAAVVTRPSDIKGNNLNNVRHESIKNFRNKHRKCLKDKINELATNSKNKNVRK